MISKYFYFILKIILYLISSMGFLLIKAGAAGPNKYGPISYFNLVMIILLLVPSLFELLATRTDVYKKDKVLFGFRPWIAQILDMYLIGLFIWGGLFQFSKIDYTVVSFFWGLSIGYYWISFSLFRKTLGMKLVGLKLVVDDGKKAGLCLASRALGLASLIMFLWWWVLYLGLFFGWLETFLKKNKNLIDVFSNTHLEQI